MRISIPAVLILCLYGAGRGFAEDAERLTVVPNGRELERVDDFFAYASRVRHGQVRELLRRLEALPPGGRAADLAAERRVADAMLALQEIRAAEAAGPLAKRIAFYPALGGGPAHDDEWRRSSASPPPPR